MNLWKDICWWRQNNNKMYSKKIAGGTHHRDQSTYILLILRRFMERLNEILLAVIVNYGLKWRYRSQVARIRHSMSIRIFSIGTWKLCHNFLAIFVSLLDKSIQAIFNKNGRTCQNTWCTMYVHKWIE